MKLSKYNDAYCDYQKALLLQPMNKSLAKDTEIVRSLILTSSDTAQDTTTTTGNDGDDDDDDDDSWSGSDDVDKIL